MLLSTDAACSKCGQHCGFAPECSVPDVHVMAYQTCTSLLCKRCICVPTQGQCSSALLLLLSLREKVVSETKAKRCVCWSGYMPQASRYAVCRVCCCCHTCHLEVCRCYATSTQSVTAGYLVQFASAASLVCMRPNTLLQHYNMSPWPI